jgi:hypothetical protein
VQVRTVHVDAEHCCPVCSQAAEARVSALRIGLVLLNEQAKGCRFLRDGDNLAYSGATLVNIRALCASSAPTRHARGCHEPRSLRQKLAMTKRQLIRPESPTGQRVSFCLRGGTPVSTCRVQSVMGAERSGSRCYLRSGRVPSAMSAQRSKFSLAHPNLSMTTRKPCRSPSVRVGSKELCTTNQAGRSTLIMREREAYLWRLLSSNDHGISKLD